MKIRLHLVDRQASGGVASPFPMVTLLVRDAHGGIVPVRFHVDTGSDCCAIPVALARKVGIPFQHSQSTPVGGMVGTTLKYRDRLRVLIGGREHTWPCEFVEVNTSVTLPKDMPQAVLGRAGLFDEYAVAIDAGFVIITRLGPVRRVVRRWLQWWWEVTGQIHSSKEPL